LSGVRIGGVAGRSDTGRRAADRAPLLNRAASQVSAKSGVFYGVSTNPGDEGPSLTVLESVRCLECGAIYSKPRGGGTARQNPGCPECGYVGWIALGAPVKETSQPRHSAGGPLPGRVG
jgi:hypothetical protein